MASKSASLYALSIVVLLCAVCALSGCAPESSGSNKKGDSNQSSREPAASSDTISPTGAASEDGTFDAGLSSLRDEGSDSLQAISNELGRALEEAREAIKEITPHARSASDKAVEGATKEFDKLYRVEYKVVSIELNSLLGSEERLQSVLTELGADRWDCFHVLQEMGKMTLFCKRYPRNWLLKMTPLSGR